MSCPTCQMPDGTPNAEYLREIGQCTFGCGATIPWGDPGSGMCGHCKDHSANHAECEACGREYEDWSEGTFAPVHAND